MTAGWEARLAPDGRTYYVNHADQTTSWEVPPGFGAPQPVAYAQPPPVAHFPPQPVAYARPVVVNAGPRQPPKLVVASPAPAPPVLATVVAAPVPPPVVAAPVPPPVVAPPPPPMPPPAACGSDAVAYERRAPPPPAPAVEAKRRSSLSAALSRAATLTKTVVVGKLAPSKLKKRGTLALDGHRRFVELADATLTIYESPSLPRDAIFRAPIKYVKVVGDGASRRTVREHRGAVEPTEIRLYVEPEALNDEHNDQNRGGGGLGGGWMMPTHLNVGSRVNVDFFTGDLKRQDFSLFCKDATEKHAWATTLHTVSSASREWAYASHEVRDSVASLRGKK